MKSNLDSLFKADADLEKDGVWMDINDNTGFKVRPFKETNPQIKAAIARFHKPFARQIELDQMPQEKLLEINVKIFVHACMTDWKGVEIDGVDTPFSKDVAVQFLVGLPNLFMALWDYSRDFENYREDVGNF